MPNDNTRFFSCVAGQPRECLSCQPGLIYFKECQKCERPGFGEFFCKYEKYKAKYVIKLGY